MATLGSRSGITFSKSGPAAGFQLVGYVRKSIQGKIRRELIVKGPASVAITDREGDLITGPALRKALPQLLLRHTISYQHLDIIVGKILAKWTGPDGVVHGTEVRPIVAKDFQDYPWLVGKAQLGDEALFVVAKIYDDTPYCLEVQDGIKKGQLNSYSISGQANAQSPKQVCGQFECKFVNVITDIALSAVTICKEGMNQASKFIVLQKGMRQLETVEGRLAKLEECAAQMQPMMASMVDKAPTYYVGRKDTRPWADNDMARIEARSPKGAVNEARRHVDVGPKDLYAQEVRSSPKNPKRPRVTHGRQNLGMMEKAQGKCVKCGGGTGTPESGLCAKCYKSSMSSRGEGHLLRRPRTMKSIEERQMRLLGKNWVPFRGARGGIGARNTLTGDVVYGAEAQRLLSGGYGRANAASTAAEAHGAAPGGEESLAANQRAHERAGTTRAPEADRMRAAEQSGAEALGATERTAQEGEDRSRYAQEIMDDEDSTDYEGALEQADYEMGGGEEGEEQEYDSFLETGQRNEDELLDDIFDEAEAYGADVSDLRAELDEIRADDPDNLMAEDFFDDVQNRLHDLGYESGFDGEQGIWYVRRLQKMDPRHANRPQGQERINQAYRQGAEHVRSSSEYVPNQAGRHAAGQDAANRASSRGTKRPADPSALQHFGPTRTNPKTDINYGMPPDHNMRQRQSVRDSLGKILHDQERLLGKVGERGPDRDNPRNPNNRPKKSDRLRMGERSITKASPPRDAKERGLPIGYPTAPSDHAPFAQAHKNNTTKVKHPAEHYGYPGGSDRMEGGTGGDEVTKRPKGYWGDVIAKQEKLLKLNKPERVLGRKYPIGREMGYGHGAEREAQRGARARRATEAAQQYGGNAGAAGDLAAARQTRQTYRGIGHHHKEPAYGVGQTLKARQEQLLKDLERPEDVPFNSATGTTSQPPAASGAGSAPLDPPDASTPLGEATMGRIRDAFAMGQQISGAGNGPGGEAAHEQPESSSDYQGGIDETQALKGPLASSLTEAARETLQAAAATGTPSTPSGAAAQRMAVTALGKPKEEKEDGEIMVKSGPGHDHTDKFERCLDHVQDQGGDAGKAHRVCYTSVGKAHMIHAALYGWDTIYKADCVHCFKIANDYEDPDAFFRTVGKALQTGIIEEGWVNTADLVLLKEELPLLSQLHGLLTKEGTPE